MKTVRGKIVEISEKELEDFLVNNPDLIEDGMRILGRQIWTDSGSLDILAVDSDGILTVIELKSEIDDGQLDQSLRYYDWVRNNIQWIAASFKGYNIDVTEEPRIVLIAPSFSENLKRIAKYVNASLDLMEFTAIELPDGCKTIVCKSVPIGRPPEPPTIPTREGHLKRIEDERLRELCRKCLEQLEGMGVEVRPIQDYWFSLRFKNKTFMYLGCRKKFFVCQIQRSDGSWTPTIKITSQESWERMLKDDVGPAIKRIQS